MKKNENKIENGTRESTDKVGAYAALTGFRRAVPIILAALAIFTGLCFVTQSTGALGKFIADILLGLFSVGGYVIPFLLALHAVFYASDVQKKRILSRVIFSILAVIFTSAIAHVIANFNTEFPFSASAFYNDGIDGKGGGFVGGAVAYLLTKAFGSVGLIIIAALIVALYITYFFAGGKNTLLKALLKIITAISDFFNGINEKKRKKIEAKEAKRNAKRDKKRATELAARHELLEDDEFFVADGAMKELKINDLGIREYREDEDIERDPPLHEKVVEDFEKKSPNADNPIYNGDAAEVPKRRRVNMDYSNFGDGLGYSPSVKNASFEDREDDIVYEEKKAPVQEKSAEEVFGDGFSAFDLKLEEELSKKASSKVNPNVQKQQNDSGISEIISEISEEDIENARRRADFEMKKKAAIEAQRRYDAARAEMDAKRQGASGAENIPAKHAEDAHGAAVNVPEVEIVYERKPIENAENQAYTNENQAPATDVRPEQRQVNTEPKKEPTLDDKLAMAQERYKRAAERANAINAYAFMQKEEEKQEYKPTQKPSEPEELKLERKVLPPTPEIEEKPIYAAENVSGADELSFKIEDDAEDDEEKLIDEIVGEEEEEVIDPVAEEDAPTGDGVLGYEYIPPSEQNPAIMDYRKLYSVLDEVNEKKEEAPEEENADADAAEYVAPEKDLGADEKAEDEEVEDDLPPFDAPTPASVIAKHKKEEVEEDEPLYEKPDYSHYALPSTDILLAPKVVQVEDSDDEINENADNLVNTLQQFGVRVSVKGVDRGPRITRYEIVPAMGVKVQSVMSLYNDIVLNLGAEGVRMEAPIPGRKAIGVEIPNKNPATVFLRELVETDTFRQASSKTIACLGKDVTGNPVFEDIAKMPHVLVAGATGMGKSVCINAILISILYKATPEDVRFIMIDPKKVEFNRYNGIPHLLIPVVTDIKQAAGALMWAVEQMEKRYDLMEKAGVTKLDSYNEMVRQDPSLGEPLPKIIIVIDELNDIMIKVRKPAEDLIMSIAQKARAAGIHLIIGTQRPSVNVVTGTIKANIPSRISCKVASFQDSKTILEQSGAEKLLNNGDMLYITSGTPKPVRVQGAYVSETEVAAVMKYLKSQVKGDIYDAQALEDINRAAQKCSKGKGGGAEDYEDSDPAENAGALGDPEFLAAVDVAIKSGKISTSLLQRKIKIGFSKAARFVDLMEELGVVSGPNAQKARDVLISSDEWHEMLARREID